jgi:hypothetical protein
MLDLVSIHGIKMHESLMIPGDETPPIDTEGEVSELDEWDWSKTLLRFQVPDFQPFGAITRGQQRVVTRDSEGVYGICSLYTQITNDILKREGLYPNAITTELGDE